MYGEESGRGRWKRGEKGEGSEERWYREGRKRKGGEGWCGGRGSVEQGGGHVERKGKIKGKRWYGEEAEVKGEGGEG